MRIFFTLVLSLYSFLLLGQLTSSTKWGKVSEKEIEYKQVPFEKEAGAVILYEEGTTTIVSFFETQIYRRIKILDESGIEAANQAIRYYSHNKSQEIIAFRAQTINTNNGKTEIIPVDKKSIFDQNLNAYWSVRKFTFPDVQVGSIIEFDYVISNRNLYYVDAWRFQHEYPTLFSAFDINNHTRLEYNFVAIGQKMLDYSVNKKSKESNRWILTNVPSYNSIDYIYNKQDMSERILLQLRGYTTTDGAFFDGDSNRKVITDWKTLNSEILNNLSTYKNNSTAKEIAASIPNGKDETETLKNVQNYFHNTYTWNGFVGIYPQLSNRDLAKKRTGNAADLNLLLNMVLENKGIKSDLVVLSSRSQGKLILTYPYLGQFDRMVNMVMLKNNSVIMMDAHDLSHDFGFMPLNNYNYFGLIVDKSKENFVGLQPPLSEYSSQQIYNIRDNKLNLVQTDKRNGYFRENVPLNLPKGIKETSLIGQAIDVLMNEVNTEKKDSEDGMYEMIRTSFETNYAGNSSFINIQNPLKELLSNYTFNEVNRKRPLEFEFPFLFKVDVVIPVPDGYKIEVSDNFNSHIETTDKSLVYFQKAFIKDDKLFLHVEFYMKKSTFEGNYAAIKSFFDKANNAASKVIIAKKN